MKRSNKVEPPEFEDISEALNGDMDAFLRIIKHYEPLAYVITRGELRNMACIDGIYTGVYSVEDLRQEFILRFMSAVKSFRYSM